MTARAGRQRGLTVAAGAGAVLVHYKRRLLDVGQVIPLIVIGLKVQLLLGHTSSAGVDVLAAVATQLVLACSSSAEGGHGRQLSS